MAKKDYAALASSVIELVGGKSNISFATHCVTRLRLNLKDRALANIEEIKKIDGVLEARWSGDQFQVIIGREVSEVYDAFLSLTGLERQAEVEADPEDKAKIGFLSMLTGAVSNIMMPLCTALVGFGILKGFTMLFEFVGILSKSSMTYTFLYNVGDSVIYFIPVIVAYSAAKYAKTNIMISIMLACTLFNPKLVALLAIEGGAEIFGVIPLANVSYASTVVPILMMIFVQYLVEKGLKKVIPDFLSRVFVPVFTVLIVMVVTFSVVGPIGTLLGQGLATLYSTIYNIAPPLAGAVVGGLWSLLVSWGMHTALVPIVINNIAVFGYDTLMAFSSCGNFGQIGGLYATWVKAKNKDIKQNALSIIIANLTSGFGLTEPIIYGNNLGLKTPFICGLLGGAVGGVVCSLMGVKALNIGAFTVYKMALYAGSLTGILVSCLLSFAVGFILTYIKGFDENTKLEGN